MPLETIQLGNRALSELPVDKEADTGVRQVRHACFSRVKPTPVKEPELVAASTPALNLLGISEDEAQSQAFVQYMSGNVLMPGSDPAAHCYCGHQFGSFAGQLGDGAAILLGEVTNSRKEVWEVQLKGSGLTPYSRSADGRKVLRSSIREFLASEAMHALGIPSTRASSVITSNSTVIRDQFYNGNMQYEKCSIVCRVAPTFFRFGSFEIFKSRDALTGRGGPSVGLEKQMLPQMLQHVIEHQYPDIWEKYLGQSDLKGMYLEFFREVVRLTAELVAKWDCVGFCHGVLNTDNMSIIGVTIDYGPYGFMDKFNPGHICNTSDNSGRYAYDQQKAVCKWNCTKLAEALQSELPLEDSLKAIDQIYDDAYDRVYWSQMMTKLGLPASHWDDYEDQLLVKGLIECMRLTGSDWTNTFRSLSKLTTFEGDIDPEHQFLQSQLRNASSVSEIAAQMMPPYNPRQLQQLQEVAEKQPSVLEYVGITMAELNQQVDRLKQAQEFAKTSEDEYKKQLQQKWTSWLNSYNQEILKQEAAGTSQSQRQAAMDAVNPRFILRNWLLERSIKQAESGDYSGVQQLLRCVLQPYWNGEVSELMDGIGADQIQDDFDQGPPQWAKNICVSCSS